MTCDRQFILIYNIIRHTHHAKEEFRILDPHHDGARHPDLNYEDLSRKAAIDIMKLMHTPRKKRAKMKM